MDVLKLLVMLILLEEIDFVLGLFPMFIELSQVIKHVFISEKVYN